MPTTNCRMFKGEIENYLKKRPKNPDIKLNDAFCSLNFRTWLLCRTNITKKRGLQHALPVIHFCFWLSIATKITMNSSALKEFDNYGYKSKMSLMIPVAIQIYIFSKNKNVIDNMQESNRTLLIIIWDIRLVAN